jgi:chromatin remodeling complex protein RSC6
MSKQVSKKTTQSVNEASTESTTKQVKAIKLVQEKAKAEPVPVPETVSEVVVEGEVVEGDDKKDDSLHTFYVELQNEISTIQEKLSTLKSNLKKFHKTTSKKLVKMSKSRRNNGQPRSPTGFGKPCFVPTSLRNLLQLKDDECVTRPSVTKKLYEYIETNSLYSETDKRLLRVNDQLSKALQLTTQEVKTINSSSSVSDKQGLNFYNIQKYVARLYPKNANSDTEVTKNIVIESSAPSKNQPVVNKKLTK